MAQDDPDGELSLTPRFQPQLRPGHARDGLGLRHRRCVLSFSCSRAPRLTAARAEFPYLIDPAAAITNYVRTNKPGVIVEPVLTDFNHAAVDGVARYADTCLVFVNADSGEGYINVRCVPSPCVPPS